MLLINEQLPTGWFCSSSPHLHTHTHTEVQADWKTSVGNLRVSLWFHSVQSSFQQPLKNEVQVFRVWFCFVPKFKSWSHHDTPELPPEPEKFCFIHILSPNRGLEIHVKSSKDILLSFGFYSQQETNLWKLISALSCSFFLLSWGNWSKKPGGAISRWFVLCFIKVLCKCMWISALKMGEDPEPKHQTIKGSLKLCQVLPARYKIAFKNSI